MSQTLTKEVAFTLKRGDIIYHNLLEFVEEDGTIVPARGKVMGKAVEHPYYGFSIPVKRLYGAQGTSGVTGVSTLDWRTVEEKSTTPHVRRVRTVHTAPVTEEEAPPPLPRVRRSRPALRTS